VQFSLSPNGLRKASKRKAKNVARVLDELRIWMAFSEPRKPLSHKKNKSNSSERKLLHSARLPLYSLHQFYGLETREQSQVRLI
jgi:hypothetical protein